MKADLPLLGDLGDLSGRSVLVRVDFNVPLANGGISDDLRVRAALPTLRWLLERGASVTAVTHLGRPRPRSGIDPVDLFDTGSSAAPIRRRSRESAASFDTAFSVAPIRRRLREFAPGVELAENLRFHPGEVADDPDFAAQLVEGHDAYVNDAFGVSHREHASIVGPPRFLPSAAGRLLQREVEVLGALRRSPRRPFVAVLGGSKAADKIGVVSALAEMADCLLIGGGMCFTFLRSQGFSTGASVCEDDMVEHCGDLLAATDKIRLPCDVVALGPDGVPGDPAAGGEVIRTGVDLPDGWAGVDIGPRTAAMFGDIIGKAGTVLWNGPLGVFEDPRFAAGTEAVALALSKSRAYTVVGGGDSIAAFRRCGVEGRVDHMSTGGGAALEFMERGDLPGLAALREAAA